MSIGIVNLLTNGYVVAIVQYGSFTIDKCHTTVCNLCDS